MAQETLTRDEEQTPERRNVGKRVQRPDATGKVTGETIYADDIQLPHMLHAKVLGSPYAHARIVSIDIIDTIAGVRLELDDWNGHRYTDLFTLLTVDGAWKIMNDVFHQHH